MCEDWLPLESLAAMSQGCVATRWDTMTLFRDKYGSLRLPSFRFMIFGFLAAFVVAGCSSDTAEDSAVNDPPTTLVASTDTPQVSAVESTPETPNPSEIRVTLTGHVGMRRSVEFLAARTAHLPGPGAPVFASSLTPDTCLTDPQQVLLTAPGNCVVELTTDLGSTAVEFVVADQPERSDIDRPGGNVLDLKPLYIRFSDSPDQRRDVNGELANFAQGLADFVAVHNPGFTLRLDTVNGLPDVQHIELPLTTQQFLDRWTENTGPLGSLLVEYGIGGGIENFYKPATWGQRLEDFTRIFVVFVEGPRGGYRSPNSNTEGGCGNTTGNAFVGYFLRDLDGKECGYHLRAAFPGSAYDWIGYDVFRLLMDPLRAHRGCDGEIIARYGTPLETRPSSITSPRDPIGYRYAVGVEFPQMLDPLRKFYFRIAEGPNVGNHCADIAFSAFMTEWGMGDQPLDADTLVTGRSLEDRPDDIDGPQVRVLYVLPADAPDLQWDVNGHLHTAVATANEWLHANGGSTVRFDTHNGELDVGFLRLPMTEATLQLGANGGKCDPRDLCPHPRSIVRIVEDMGAMTPGKIHAVIWGGQLMSVSTRAAGCAGAMEDAVFLSPVLRFAATGHIGCFMDVEATVPDSANTLGLVLLHEVFHVLGAVDGRAPDTDGQYHIKGDPTDLMGGSAGIVQLDPQRRNYWKHGRNDLTDVAASAFVESKPSQLTPSTRIHQKPWWVTEVPFRFDPFALPSDDRRVNPQGPDGGRGGASSSVGSASPYSSDTRVSEPCGDETSPSGVTFSGSLRAVAGSEISDASMGLIWVDEGSGRCIAAVATTNANGSYSIDLPEAYYRNAAWEDGGGYCVVWDINNDGVFDSANEPLGCLSDVTPGTVILSTIESQG